MDSKLEWTSPGPHTVYRRQSPCEETEGVETIDLTELSQKWSNLEKAADMDAAKKDAIRKEEGSETMKRWRLLLLPFLAIPFEIAWICKVVGERKENRDAAK